MINANASGAGSADGVAARATDALRAAGATVRARFTADERDLADAVHVAGDARLVLVGGDGTVHALANVDLPVLPPVALLPAGRANNIARALGIPTDWEAAARVALSAIPARIDALHVVTPERRLFAVEGVSAGFHAAARHRYDGTNSADLVAGIARARRRAAVVPAPRGRAARRRRPVRRRARRRRCSCPTCRSSGSASTSTRSPTRPTAVWRRSSSTRERGGTSSGRSPRRATGRHLRRPGTAWRRAGRADLVEPLPLVADAQPLGVTTATVTVAAGRLRLVAPEVRT